MSSKIAKRMMARVDDMVSRAAASVNEQAGAGVSSKTRKKTARRALLAGLSEGGSKKAGATGGALGIGASKSGRKAKKAHKSGSSGWQRRSLLEEARRELKGKSRVTRNVNLMTYARQERVDGVGAKAHKAVEKLLRRDQAMSRK